MTMVVHGLCRYRTKLFWVVFVLQALLIYPDTTSEISSTYELCKRGEVLENYVLRGGKKAGSYYKIGSAVNHEKCFDLCCSDDDCNLALFVKSSCYSVECRSAELCKPIKVHRKLATRPWIFRRYRATVNHERDSSFQLPDVRGSNVTLKREKRFGSCQHYAGTTCENYLDKDRFIYYEETPSVVEHRLSGPLTVIEGHFSPQCKKYALPALCLTSFPYCESVPHPQPIRLCREDCDRLYQGVCNHDFNLAKRVSIKYPPLLKIMPNCSDLTTLTNEGDDCVKLGLNEDNKEVSTTISSLRKTGPGTGRTTPEVNHISQAKGFSLTEPVQPHSQTTSNSDLKEITPTKTSIENVERHEIKEDDPGFLNQSRTFQQTPVSELESNDSHKRTDDLFNETSRTNEQKKESTENSTSTPITPMAKFENKSLTLLSSVFTQPKMITAPSSSTGAPATESIAPTVVNINGSNDGLDLELSNKDKKQETLLSSVKHKHPTKAFIKHLHVSTVGDKEITLPKDTASLYASAWPKQSNAHPYTYQWLKIASPENNNGYMEGKNAQRVVLTKLNKPGIYQFEVTVHSPHFAFGKAHVNVTVRQPKHVNKPPRADISPKEQSITLPTNTVVLDGSKSSDDDKITEYKWQELKGPLTEKNKIIKSGVESPVLQLKSLLPGVYTYKLTVKDSDGETDSTTATVTVNAEKDYPPQARAGNDVVITLPENFVTLYGNGSSDDHGIKNYEWSKSPLSPACDLQGSTGPILHVSNMVMGDYTFALKVTDSGGQSSESKVTVVVRPEKNSPPVVNAGDDKVSEITQGRGLFVRPRANILQYEPSEMDLVYPDDSTTLSAKESHDDQGISKYKWEKLSGPSSVEMSGVDRMLLGLSHLTEGHYVFKLTVYDTKGLTGTDTVSVNVKRDINKPPNANAGPDVIVKLPNRATALDGSKSSDDYGIVKYMWTRDLKSPAAGDVINNSDHQPVLRLSNLVEGVYRFRLVVKDSKGLESSDDAHIFVKEDEKNSSLVELYLDVDVTSFLEENKIQLVRKLAVSLNVMDSDIVIEHIQPSGRGSSLVVLFYVKDGLTKLTRDGKDIADLLKQKLGDNFFEFKMLEVEPYICRNNCSSHGLCDKHTKQCVCDSFWMQDPFKARFGLRESNCDWSILYVTVVVFAIIVVVVSITWAVCFCLGRTKSRKRKNQYSIVGEDSDDAKNETMELFPRGKFLNSSIMSETDMDSDEETLFENEKPYKSSRPNHLNGFINGTRKKSHHT